MSQEYTLVNPFIIGKMKTTFSAGSSIDAATKAYKSLSKYFNNDIPSLNFTLQKTSGGNIGGGRNSSYYHFNVAETKKDKKVDYKIKAIKPAFNSEAMKIFKNQLKSTNSTMVGGARRKKRKTRRKRSKPRTTYNDDLSDDEDEYEGRSWLDDPDDIRYPVRRYSRTYLYSSPISYYWYTPYVYNISTRVHFPTFVAPLHPYIVSASPYVIINNP